MVKILTVSQAISLMPGPSNLPWTESTEAGVLHAAQEPVLFKFSESKPSALWLGVNSESALMTLVSSERIQEATGLDRQGLLRRFAQQWSTDSALRECELFVGCAVHYKTDRVS
jgi:hypothetical protein